METQVITRTKINAKTAFAGIPSKFKFKANGKYFPYAKEAHEEINSGGEGCKQSFFEMKRKI